MRSLGIHTNFYFLSLLLTEKTLSTVLTVQIWIMLDYKSCCHDRVAFSSVQVPIENIERDEKNTKFINGIIHRGWWKPFIWYLASRCLRAATSIVRRWMCCAEMKVVVSDYRFLFELQFGKWIWCGDKCPGTFYIEIDVQWVSHYFSRAKRHSIFKTISFRLRVWIDKKSKKQKTALKSSKVPHHFWNRFEIKFSESSASPLMGRLHEWCGTFGWIID